MADEVLSKSEIDDLLTQMETDSTGGPLPSASAARAKSPDKKSQRNRERVVPYDFKRPERVGKEQMRALRSLHEGFSRNFAAALSGLLRTLVDVKLTSVEQMTYSEFVFTLETPTCFNLLKAKQLEGTLILDLNPAIIYPMIDRLLGGGREVGLVSRRPMTEIELRLVSKITGLFMRELSNAWEKITKLDLTVERVESNPHLVQVVPPNEVVLLISLEVTLGDVRGMINLCIPFNSIERVSTQLAANTWVSQRQNVPTEASQQTIAQHLDKSRVEVVVTLAESIITTADLVGLRVGDIITTDKDIQTPLDVAIEGVSRFQASPGALKGQKAIQVEGIIAPPQLTSAAEPNADAS